jgi:type II secretory pathway predicted ATPase ExeA
LGLSSDQDHRLESREARRASAGVVALDPFGETSNPDEYVPREASEEGLLALERAVRSGRTAALSAPPGFGKTLFLRLLAKRLAPGFRCLFLPYAAVTSQELCAWSLGLLGEDSGEDARGDFLRFVRREAERGEVFVLLIDDGNSMPLETAQDLGQLVRESGNRLRVVLAATDDSISSRVFAALRREIVDVRLSQPMSLLETQLYVLTRLQRACLPNELCERFNDAALERIHRLSGGVPRRVHDLGRSLLEDAPTGVGRAWSEERWLGTPLDDLDIP